MYMQRFGFGGTSTRAYTRTQARGTMLVFTRYCFTFEALLLHNNIPCKHSLYCAIYCTILPVIAPPRSVLRCF